MRREMCMLLLVWLNRTYPDPKTIPLLACGTQGEAIESVHATHLADLSLIAIPSQ